ncbi:TetR/AcrR family transcriptional regulator [Pseudolysinimonas sp.]|uniref:TetR/AcrR family transcriptional regulator n=1 Tax=Pseudolysinimonas sp. TaxID=2680009 RepID=UPI003F8163C6
MNGSLRDRILDAASDIVINDGLAAASTRAIAHHAGVDPAEIDEAYTTREHLLMDLLNREFAGIRRIIADNIERDPAGGLLSRIYHYSLGALHERPLARALYLEDGESLTQIMRATHDTEYFPQLGADPRFLADMQEVGMIRPDIRLDELAAFLSAYMAGAAVTASHVDVNATTAALVTLLERGADADVDDTEPGKRALFDLIARNDGH